MRKEFFKVCIVQGNHEVVLNIPATEFRLFQLVYDCLTSDASIEVLDIHDRDLSSEVDHLSYNASACRGID